MAERNREMDAESLKVIEEIRQKKEEERLIKEGEEKKRIEEEIKKKQEEFDKLSEEEKLNFILQESLKIHEEETKLTNEEEEILKMVRDQSEKNELSRQESLKSQSEVDNDRLTLALKISEEVERKRL